MGLEALRRVARHADGRAPETHLRDLILEALALTDAQGLIQWAQDASRADVAGLVPTVSRAAAAGDAVAGEIMVHAVEELEGHVLTILESLGPWARPPGLALSGGLLQPDGPLRASLERVLARHHLVPSTEALDPARGAARMALALLSG